MADISKIALGQQELSDVERVVVFECFIRRLVDHRNLALTFVGCEWNFTRNKAFADGHAREISRWAEEMLKHAWEACEQPGSGG
jgi:hypothetical protein